MSASLITADTRRVVVGVDDTRAGLAALAVATELAVATCSPLVAVRAWELGLPRHGGRRLRHVTHPHVILSFSGAEQIEAADVLVRRVFCQATGDYPPGVPVTIETPESDPGLALTAIARQPGDVLVIGRQPGRHLRRLVHGSVSSYCSRRAVCPVIVVPPR